MLITCLVYAYEKYWNASGVGQHDLVSNNRYNDLSMRSIVP